jgi:hypothetical protein
MECNCMPQMHSMFVLWDHAWKTYACRLPHWGGTPHKAISARSTHICMFSRPCFTARFTLIHLGGVLNHLDHAWLAFGLPLSFDCSFYKLNHYPLASLPVAHKQFKKRVPHQDLDCDERLFPMRDKCYSVGFLLHVYPCIYNHSIAPKQPFTCAWLHTRIRLFTALHPRVFLKMFTEAAPPLRPCLPMLQKIHNQKMGCMQPIAWPIANFLEFKFVNWMVNHDISQGSCDKLIKLPIVSEHSMHKLQRLTYNVQH